MGGDEFRQVTLGRPVLAAPRAWNAALQAGFALRGKAHDIRADLAQQLPQAGVVYVRNDSGGNRNPFDVLGITRPLIPPSANLAEFQRQVALAGELPQAGDSGRFALLLDALPPGAIGRAVVSGVVPGRVLVEPATAGLGCADVIPGEATSLQLVASGGAQVLWHDAGYGVVNAVLRLGAVCAPFPVSGSASGSMRFGCPDCSNLSGHNGCLTLHVPPLFQGDPTPCGDGLQLPMTWGTGADGDFWYCTYTVRSLTNPSLTQTITFIVQCWGGRPNPATGVVEPPDTWLLSAYYQNSDGGTYTTYGGVAMGCMPPWQFPYALNLAGNFTTPDGTCAFLHAGNVAATFALGGCSGGSGASGGGGGCPSGSSPPTVHMTVTDLGGCGCLAGTYLLSTNGAGQYSASPSVCGWTASAVVAFTGSPLAQLSLSCGGTTIASGLPADAGSSCSPLAVTFSNNGAGLNVLGPCCAGLISVTITP